MDQNAEIETESDVLKRIVALLFSLAGLAERASVRSYPVRCLVLWLLRPTEVVVRDWLVADGWEEPQTAESAVLHRNSRAEAMHLARSLRALAHLLRCELRLAEKFARRLTRGLGQSLGDYTPTRPFGTPSPQGGGAFAGVAAKSPSPLWGRGPEGTGGGIPTIGLSWDSPGRCFGSEAAPRLDTS
ncbi:MAG: hypothetical protein AB7I34_02625 [Rhizobiaceae bacterium]